MYTAQDMITFGTFLNKHFMLINSKWYSKNTKEHGEANIEHELKVWTIVNNKNIDLKISKTIENENFRTNNGIKQFYSHLEKEWCNV